MANGNGVKATIIVFGVITAIIVPSLFFIGTNVIANDKKNTDDHVNITAEMVSRDEKMMTSLHNFDKRQAVFHSRQEVLIDTVKQAIQVR